ncbi:MAG: ROK family protein [Acidobacteriota bacterium]|nr:ROK family protein [Acidobacteriota bacterium]MDE3043705.1 ROK family protein [Acidobacteriota bacterium]MDE3107059.1 ROK family protein [Acidobacteriota bacterium]MDE3222437.1 ROK family protein [Acidobacteriota bacterium]
MNRAKGALDDSLCLAIDVGATKIDVAVVGAAGRLLSRDRLAVADYPTGLFDALVTLARSVKADYPTSRVGVACAGPIAADGARVSPLNIAQWREFPLRAQLEGALGLPVRVEGDARALALAEGVYGAARRERSYLSMVVSSGVGGGIVLNGRLLDGNSSNAGHVGHLTVVPQGALCGCGAYGCLEAEASGRAIEARTGRAAALADLATRQRTGALVGQAVGNVCSLLDLTRCYVGGSVALGFGDDFFDEANKSARRVAQLSFASDVRVAPTALGDEGSLLGAALVAWGTPS